MNRIDNDMSYEPDAGSLSATIYLKDFKYNNVLENLMVDYGAESIEVVLNFEFDNDEFYLFGGLVKVDNEELEYQDIEDWGDLKETLSKNLYDYFISKVKKGSGEDILTTFEDGGLAEYLLYQMDDGNNNINIDNVEYIGHSNDSGLSSVNVKIDTIKKGLSDNHYFDKIKLTLSFELDGKDYSKTFSGDAFDVAVEAEEYLEHSFFN